MLKIDGVTKSLASISPYPWSFDGVDVVDANGKSVAERKRSKEVGDTNAAFIAAAPTVIKALAEEVVRLRKTELYLRTKLMEEKGWPKSVES